MPAPRTPYGRSLLEVEAVAAGVRAAPRRRRCARCGTRRSSARTCRARSGGCCACRSCRCPRSPIRRSRCCTPTTRPRRWSPRSSTATTDRCNVVGPGAATPWQAVRLGGRVPAAGARRRCGTRRRASTELAGAAIAPHVVELLRHGRTGDGSARSSALGLDAVCARRSSVLRELFEWADVVPIPTEPRGGGMSNARPSSGTTTDSRSTTSSPHRVVPSGRMPRGGSAAAIRSIRSARPAARRLVRAGVQRRRPRRRDRRRARPDAPARAVLVVEPRLRRLRAGRARHRGATRDRPPAARHRRARRCRSSAARAAARRDRPTSAPDLSTCVRAGHLVARAARADVAAHRCRHPAAAARCRR